jgi:hypothetical protein
LAVGDALGTTLEFTQPRTFEPIIMRDPAVSSVSRQIPPLDADS